MKTVFLKFEQVPQLIEDNVDLLEEDGTNWLHWVHTIDQVIEYVTGKESYMSGIRPLIGTAHDAVIDYCALEVIRRTVHPTLEGKIVKCHRAHYAKYCLRRHLDPYGDSICFILCHIA